MVCGVEFGVDECASRFVYSQQIKNAKKKKKKNGKKKRVKDQSVQSLKWLLRKQRRFFFFRSRHHSLNIRFVSFFSPSFFPCTTLLSHTLHHLVQPPHPPEAAPTLFLAPPPPELSSLPVSLHDRPQSPLFPAFCAQSPQIPKPPLCVNQPCTSRPSLFTLRPPSAVHLVKRGHERRTPHVVVVLCAWNS